MLNPELRSGEVPVLSLLCLVRHKPCSFARPILLQGTFSFDLLNRDGEICAFHLLDLLVRYEIRCPGGGQLTGYRVYGPIYNIVKNGMKLVYNIFLVMEHLGKEQTAGEKWFQGESCGWEKVQFPLLLTNGLHPFVL